MSYNGNPYSGYDTAPRGRGRGRGGPSRGTPSGPSRGRGRGGSRDQGRTGERSNRRSVSPPYNRGDYRKGEY